ncbi:MAG TPA: hypothetical protein VFR86_29660 [Burkholderiaceae bacterium]|nr:hypothetical protein [Burkholderiaceae bacterium]
MNMVAVREAREVATVRPLRVVPDTAPQAALTAQLLQALTRALMQGVHEAASLNVATVQALLAPTDGSLKGELGRVTESWRFSWRTYQICATTAANVMRLADAHTRAGVDALWNLFEKHVDNASTLEPTQADALREALDALRESQRRYFEAAIETHRRLIGLVSGDTAAEEPAVFEEEAPEQYPNRARLLSRSV